jgi:hypothetical protein
VCRAGGGGGGGCVRISARDLVKETIYWMPRAVHPAFYDQVMDYLHGVGIDSYNLQEARAILQGIGLAANKLGVAVVPQSAARFHCPEVLFKQPQRRSSSLPSSRPPSRRWRLRSCSALCSPFRPWDSLCF